MISEEYPQLLLSDHEALVRQEYPDSPFLVLRHSFWVTRPQILPIPPPRFYRSLSLGSDLLLPLLLRRLGRVA